jgi:hypothetical protein
MEHNGPISTYPPLERYCLAAIMLAGCEILTAAAVFLLGLLPYVNHHPVFPPYRTFVLTPEGQVFIRTYGTDGMAGQLTEVDGKPVTDERYLGNDSYDHLTQFSPICYDLRHGRRETAAFLRSHPRLSGNFFLSGNDADSSGPEAWYYLAKKNVYVGYDRVSRRRIGFIDAEGFQREPTGLHPFSEVLRTPSWTGLPYLGWSKTQLYHVSFSRRTIETIFTAPQDVIGGAGVIRTERDKPLYIAVALQQEMQLLDMKGNPLLAIPYHHDPAKWKQLMLGTTSSGDRIFLNYSPGFEEDYELTKGVNYLDEIDRSGKAVHTDSVAMGKQSGEAGGWAHALEHVTVPLPVAVCFTILSARRASGFSDFTKEFVGPGMPMSRLPILAVVFLALAIFAWFWGRRAGLERKTAWYWAVFVFLFGLPGLLAYRLVAGWPARVRCPSCSHRRPIETEACPACRKPWPAPKPSGTEIFHFSTNGLA